jgi:hypothetical protein
MNDDEFYRRLWCSISEASKFSYSFKIKDIEAVFDGNPSLILGTGHIGYNNSDEIITDDGNTFKIGHSFFREFGNIYGLEVNENELHEINKKMQDFYKKLKNPSSDGYIKSYFVLEQINKKFISKIHSSLHQ